jgi:transcriptional regulator with XRE-family HTH domain
MRLRLLRTARGLDIKTLAACAGLSRTSVSAFELGGTSRPETLTRYALALEVDRAALEDDVECFRALARVTGVQLPREPAPSIPARVSALLERAGPERAEWVVRLLEAQVGLALAGPPPGKSEGG